MANVAISLNLSSVCAEGLHYGLYTTILLFPEGDFISVTSPTLFLFSWTKQNKLAQTQIALGHDNMLVGSPLINTLCANSR